jgi:hypothetical protein
MKLDALRKIIKEELSSALKENTPATKEKETKEKKITPTKPQPRRKIGREDIPKESPTPAKALTSLKETEKELVSKITARFLKSKK